VANIFSLDARVAAGLALVALLTAAFGVHPGGAISSNLGFDARIVNARLQEIARRGGAKWYSADRSQERHQRNNVQHIQ